MFGEGGEGFVVALRDLAGVGELERMGRTLNPWIKTSRSVFFFMTALCLYFEIVVVFVRGEVSALRIAGWPPSVMSDVAGAED